MPPTGGIPYLVVNVSDLYGARILDTSQNFATVNFPEKTRVDRHKVHVGDVLLACRGSGFPASVARQLGNAVASANLMILRPAPTKVLPEFLLGWLMSPAGQRALMSRRRGITMMALSRKDVSALQVPVPPLDVQHPMASLITETELAYRAAIESAELRRTLGYAVFAETLRPDDNTVHVGITKTENQ